LYSLAAAAALGVLLALPTAAPASAQGGTAQSSGDAATTQAPTPGQNGNAAGTGSPEKKRKGRRGGRRSGPETVVVDAVVVGAVTETAPVYGRLVARDAGVVASRTRGAVGKIHVQVGDRVTRGAPLVSLVTDTLRAERALREAELREFSAKIETAEAQLRLAEQELARLNRLRTSAAFSPARYQDKLRDVERFRSARVEAQAKAEQARAQLRMADIDLAYAEIRAPYDGAVSQRHAELGSFLNVGDKVVTLINDTALEIEAEVPSIRLGGLTPGTVIEVRSERGRTFPAAVRAVVPVENPLSRTRTVRFVPKVDVRSTGLAANESMVLSVPTGPPRTAMSVHKDAIVQRRGQSVVFVVADGKAVMRTVRLGAALGTRFEVLDGLRAGDSVVVRGNERLRDGQEVKSRPAAEARRREPSAEGGS
jgi:RND family efflux transporter MFP subunit